MSNLSREEFAKMLDGRLIGEEITKDECKLAKDNGLIVIFGASDDLMEFRGAIYDETGPGTIKITKKGLVNNECRKDDCPYFERYEKSIVTAVRAMWCDPNIKASWSYVTNVSHSSFRIMEDGETYCIGIIISINDLDEGI